MATFDEYVTKRIEDAKEEIARRIEAIDLSSNEFQSLNAVGMKMIALKIVRES